VCEFLSERTEIPYVEILQTEEAALKKPFVIVGFAGEDWWEELL
jgi:hypothetical protein